MVRNAIDHGLEAPEERTVEGKHPRGRLVLETRTDGDHFVISLEDDGRGVARERLREKAAERGLPHASQDDLVQAMFAPELSTKVEVSSTSGRGVGLAAMRASVEALEGTVEVTSRVGSGTRFSFRFPRSVVDAAPQLLGQLTPAA